MLRYGLTVSLNAPLPSDEESVSKVTASAINSFSNVPAHGEGLRKLFPAFGLKRFESVGQVILVPA